MKTADLIPLILLELNERDKYGFELTKNIETKSNGKIIIKQPTLYTLLKKLEKSRFIASYWQDSEIGGKRHYCKLTENGRMQVSTLPSYDFLLNNALSDENENDETTPTSQDEQDSSTKHSIMDELLNNKPTPTETILPTEEVFADDNIDSSTELEINVSNTNILKTDNIASDEQFATNENVMKFTEKVVPSIENKIDINPTTDKSNDILDVKFSIPKTETTVKFVDYIDIKNNDNYKFSKKVAKKLLLQSLATSLSMIGLLVICSIITMFTSRSGLYYFFFISGILVALFYPILISINLEKLRLKYQANKYESKSKIKFFVGLTVILLLLLVVIVVNISIGNNSIGLMLSFKNFENFYAPILISATYFLDLLYNHLFLSKIK